MSKSDGDKESRYLPCPDHLKARANDVKYFVHDQPLIFNIEDEDEDDRKGFEGKDLYCCNGCGFKIGSRWFSCMKNCGFLLHEFCASVPKTINDYPEHHRPEHTLTLCTLPHHNSDLHCHVCDVSHRSGIISYYHCGACNFSVDLRCASTYFLVSSDHHKHELPAHPYPASFLCAFCGEKHSEFGLSYQCRTCLYWIHEQCYSLDERIKHGSHVHQLQLYLLEGKTFLNDICGVCDEIINRPAFSLYYCVTCKYGIHIKCSTKKWDATIETPIEQYKGNDHKLIQFPLPSTKSVQDTLDQFIQNTCQWKDAENKINDDILHHPAHDHPLITLEFDSSRFITSIDSEDITKRGRYDVCNACVLPLLDAPLYSCHVQSCKFVLHKWCAKLPRELKHHAHTDPGHTLILQEKLDKCFGFFRCKGCKEVGNGFAYKCNECEEYYLDVRCAALPSLVNYESHDHPLLLKHRRSGGGCILCGNHNFQGECNCKSCNYSSTISQCISLLLFGCDFCHFYIDIKCLMLPREILHWYDEHGFKLTDSTVLTPDPNQDVVDYHCEFCEKTLEPNQWTYHCSECEQCLGIQCVRKAFGLLPSLIKGGGCYDSPHHLHPLTCIAISGILCSRCHEDCFIFGIGFQCRECGIVFGLECAYSNE